jgi:hypothetical protein
MKFKHPLVATQLGIGALATEGAVFENGARITCHVFIKCASTTTEERRIAERLLSCESVGNRDQTLGLFHEIPENNL